MNNPSLSEGRVSVAWSQWFMQVFRACSAVYESGTTADRPVKGLWVGRPYLDTTLNKPIWYTTAGWIDATGSLV